ncbi:LIC_10190 family membrane protein [Crocosphaera sp. Alani8]|uniref:LIC_10190 family membrane protein n=1 Tax=Crocosphaera sp. Alani8 TaxID=3038952 RepID=UPI00313E52E6
MVSFLVTWLILLPICTLIGLWLLNVCEVKDFSWPGDRFIISVWLGITVLCLSCISVGLILPLSPLTGLLIGIIWIFLVYFFPKARQDFYQLWRQISLNALIQGFIIALGVAIFTTQQIIWFDSGLYHLGSIHWMAKFGAVPGIALIHSKLGFTSSWFAFSAPLVWNWTEGKVGAISNGYLLLISFFHICFIFHKLRANIANFSDKFIIIFLVSILFIYLADNVNGNSLISFSQDIPVALLIGIISWVILIITPEKQQTATRFNKLFFNSEFIPLLLSIGATSIKITAVPALGVILLFYIYKKKLSFQTCLISLGLITILLLPNFIFSLNSSGCPLYPSNTMCLNLPWTVSQEIIESENKNIIGQENDISSMDDVGKVVRNRWSWFLSSKKIQVTVLLYLCSIVLTGLSFKNKWIFKYGQTWLFALGLLGGTFIIVVIPLIRFGIGYFLVIPSLFSANLWSKKYQKPHVLIFNNNMVKVGKYLPIFIILLLFLMGRNDFKERIIFPAQLPEHELIKMQKNDINYSYPADFKLQCWGADLPCAALEVEQNIRLRDQEKGISAGFQYM